MCSVDQLHQAGAAAGDAAAPAPQAIAGSGSSTRSADAEKTVKETDKDVQKDDLDRALRLGRRAERRRQLAAGDPRRNEALAVLRPGRPAGGAHGPFAVVAELLGPRTSNTVVATAATPVRTLPTSSTVHLVASCWLLVAGCWSLSLQLPAARLPNGCKTKEY
jgi:hypothetical protein